MENKLIPYETIEPATKGDLRAILKILKHYDPYITRLAISSREHPMLSLGISPRGALNLSRMARACAYLHGRDFVIVEDVQEIFSDVCAHRVLLSQKARSENITPSQVMEELLSSVQLPNSVKSR